MLVELKSKSQVTIPKNIITELGLEQGAQFEVVVDKDEIKLIPVAIYREEQINEIKRTVAGLKESIAKGEREIYESVDELFDHLDSL